MHRTTCMCVEARRISKNRQVALRGSHPLFALDPTCHAHAFSPGSKQHISITSRKSTWYKIATGQANIWS
jgi:hypothetical protein